MTTDEQAAQHSSVERPPGQLVIQIARFHCGCLYRRLMDRIWYCPEHRGLLTGEEMIRLPRSVRSLTPHSIVRRLRPEHLRNTESNSLHQETITMSPRGEEWDREEGSMGLCLPCYLEEEEVTETGAAACECGDADCFYRWCGSTKGAHAFWSLHAAGLIEHATGITGKDFFATTQWKGPELSGLLDAERRALDGAADRTARDLLGGPRPMPDHLEKLNQTATFRRAALRIHVIRTALTRMAPHWDADAPSMEIPKEQMELPGIVG